MSSFDRGRAFDGERGDGVVVKRIGLALIAALIFIAALSFYTFAEDEQIDCYDEYRQMLEALPDEVASLFPEKLFSGNIQDVADGAQEITDFGYIIKTVFSFIGLEIGGILKLFVTLLGILILAATMNVLKDSFSSTALSSAFSVCTSCTVFLVAAASQYTIVRAVSDFFTRICTLANTMIPLMGALYAMGGNVGSAVVNHSSLIIFMNIVENFCARSALPMAGVCMAFAGANALSPDISLGGIAGVFKKFYTNTLTFVMTIFGTVMTAQNLLASKADTLAGKTAKFAVGNLIPVVGSALAGTLGTVGTSIEYIRSSVGVIGIIGVILMVVPTIITLLLTKLVLSLASGTAEILGCGREGKIIGELSGINGFLLAAACICSVTFIFLLTLFAKCSSAVGGGI